MNYQIKQNHGVPQGSGGSLNDFTFQQKIGEGSYSSVHKVTKKSDGKIYALKKVRLDSLKPKEKENALNEVRILASINHTHIIQYKDTFFDERTNSLCLVMEFAEDGDLQRKIDNFGKTRQHFPETEVWKIFTHCLRGLQILHGMKILHRDIKCANIFISKDGNYKLGDLNVSKVAKKGLVYTQTGTPYYASPEVWRDEPYDFKSDIWSLGCIIYELCALKPPFRAKNMEGLYSKVTKGVFERIPRIYSDDLAGVISLCLKVNSAMRPSCKQLLSNAAVKRNTQKFHVEVSHQDLNTIELENNFNLLNTIKVPKNMRHLADKLPKNKYEDIQQNQSFDNADLRNLQNERKNKESSKRANKISSALPNYSELSHNQVHQQLQQQQDQPTRNNENRGKSENQRILNNNNSNSNHPRLPNIYENLNPQQQQQKQKQNAQQQQQQQQYHNNKSNNNQDYNNNHNNGSLPKINNNNIVNSPYNSKQVQDNRQKQNSNYHYIEGDSYSINSNPQHRRKQPSDLSQMHEQLARKERLLLQQQQGQHKQGQLSQNQIKNQQQYDMYMDNSRDRQQQQMQYNSPKIQVTDSKSQYYNQQMLANQQRKIDNSSSRIANLYENSRQGYNYQPSPITHKKSKQPYMTPFNPITQVNGNDQNGNKPVWWG